MALLGFALAFAGFTAVCLAMDRHQRTVWRHPPARRIATALRAVGFTLLALAALPCLVISDGSNGALLWLGLLSTAGISLIFLLPYAPRVAAGIAVIAPFAAALLSVASR